VIGDIANAIWQIKEDIVPSAAGISTPCFAPGGPSSSTAPRSPSIALPDLPACLVRQVREAMPADGIICLDNGVYKIWFARNYPARGSPIRCCSTTRWRRWAPGLPSAMASAMVYPERKVMAICGDGGFMMNSQEMETAVRLKLNITVLILNDNSYGMIRWKQANMGFKDWGLTYGNPDFVKYAESYGAHGHRVESAEGVPELLRHCLARPESI
jgi:acetolactate synthase-1/2/3 large subunit